jgi:hypothetical protein
MKLPVMDLIDCSEESAGKQKTFSALEFLFEDNQVFKKRNK